MACGTMHSRLCGLLRLLSEPSMTLGTMLVCEGFIELGQKVTGCQGVERFVLVLEGALGTAVNCGPL